MKKLKRTLLAVVASLMGLCATASVTNPVAVSELLDRVGGAGASGKIVTVLDESIADGGKETFVITSQGDKPMVKGSTLSALTTGLGWYLNHYLNVNLSWNHITDPTLASLNWPTPATEEKHTSRAVYRYYLNYCTVSYSMSTWTWERWQQEIDWMALRGINMPLQIVGAEEVWRKFLMEDCGYTKEEVNAFVPGPAYVAWWGMANLEGAGGPNPDWWYERQATVGKQIVERMRSLGIEPVLPGFYMVPSNFTTKTKMKSFATGKWCGFTRPNYADGADAKFAEYAAKYYARLHEVLGGPAKYYSMDPYHEGSGNAQVADADNLYPAMLAAMKKASPDSKHVIQSWQWNACQWRSIEKETVGDLIVLDLYSDGKPGWGNYGNHDVVYSTIFNFGARTGFFGRFNGVIDGYFNAVNSKSTVKGIGAAPEGIEQTPVMYDLLFELPWLAQKPDAKQWMADYAKRRYGVENADAAQCWELLRTSALDCKTSLQGPHEAVMCGRPALNINKVSTWGNSEIFYDTSLTAAAVYNLLNANLTGDNYSYDLADLTRQALTDYSKTLLAELNSANSAGDTQRFAKARDNFLSLMLDIDELLNTNALFMLGHWTELSRGMANDVAGTSVADQDNLEANNARQLITTWGPQAQAEGGGLRDYSYRQWGGMLKDFYYERWKTWFDGGMNAPSDGWFQWEWNWAHTLNKHYPTTPVGNTREVAERILPKYISPFISNMKNVEPMYIYRLITTDLTGKLYDEAKRDMAYKPNFETTGAQIASIAIDFDRNTSFVGNEIANASEFHIPADAPIGERKVKVTLSDGTTLTYTLCIVEDITAPRTVTALSADTAMGTVAISGTTASTITNMEAVTITATPALAYDFEYWTDSKGNNCGNDNPYVYYGKEAETFTAHFIENKWGVPAWNGTAKDRTDMANYQQFLTSMSVTQGGETTQIYSNSQLPADHYISIPSRVRTAPGQEFTIRYNGAANGLQYLFLSAYCDFNHDGIYDPQTELLGTIGTRNDTNTAVGEGVFKILMPFDAKIGTTHMRLRFDGAWGEGYNDTYKAFTPDAATNRLVYELIVEVNEAADYVTNVKVLSSNPGGASVRSENESNVYTPGEEVILTAFLSPGFHLSGWKDQLSRELPAAWRTDNSINFKAYDNAVITAVIEAEPVTIGDWTFENEPTADGKECLSRVITEGSPLLDLSAVANIAPGIFAGTSVEEITLPSHALIGDEKVLASKDVTGTGAQFTTQLGKTFSGSSPYNMVLEVHNGGNAFNEWGTPLFANGTNSLADNYSGGWSQFYLKKDGTLDVKWDSGTAVSFSEVKLLGDSKITVDFDGAKSVTITATDLSSGLSQTRTIANSSTMQNISQFACALPSDMTIKVSFLGDRVERTPGEIVAGAKRLMKIHGGNADEIDGVLYAKGSTVKVVAYPEGRLHTNPFRLKNTSSVWISASPMADGSNATIGTSESTISTLWILNDKGEKSALMNVNARMGANSTIASLSNDAAEFAYTLTYGTKMPSLKFGSKKYTIDPATGFTLPAGDNLCVALPYPVIAPEGCAMVSAVTSAGTVLTPVYKGGVIPTATPFIYSSASTAEFPFLRPEVDVLPTNVMHAALLETAITEPVYLVEDGKFVKKTTGTIPANSGYLLASEVPESLGDEFSISGEDGISHIIADKEEIYFDLLGRRVSHPAAGIYLTPTGDKIRK